MAAVLRGQGERGAAQNQVPRRSGLRRQHQNKPAGVADAPGREAVHLPLETRQTHSPSPLRVRGAESCTSNSAAGAAMVFQSNSNI